MPNSSRDRVGFNIEAESAPDFSAVTEDEPFRIALLGDFSGRSERAPMAARKPLLIDRDNFNAVLQKLNVGIELSTGRLPIGDLDHFHPDHIYSTYPAFREFRETRAKLADPETFSEAARDLLGDTPAPMPAPASGGFLDLILGQGAAAAKPARKADDLQKFVEEAVRPHLVARQDPRAPELIRQVDDIASDIMRVIVHNPKFKAIEAAWRTAFLLIRRLETGPELKIYLVDVTKEELGGNIEEVYNMLIRRSDPWAVIAANYSFGTEDYGLLSVMGKIASKARAPFLAEADLSLLGGDPYWAAFRRTPEAAHIGLALPRVLVRLPYGKQTVPCEAFDFNEVSGKPDPKRMLFGSPAFFSTMLIGEAFQKHGWSLKPGMIRDITDLPVYTYEDDGESKAFPCAEIEMTEETAEALIEQGFIPLASIRNRDVVRVLMFQSVAAPPTALRGRWQ